MTHILLSTLDVFSEEYQDDMGMQTKLFLLVMKRGAANSERFCCSLDYNSRTMQAEKQGNEVAMETPIMQDKNGDVVKDWELVIMVK